MKPTDRKQVYDDEGVWNLQLSVNENFTMDNGQEFDNFDESMCQGISFDTKMWTCHWKTFPLMFWPRITSLISWTTDNIKVLKNLMPYIQEVNTLAKGSFFSTSFMSSI